MHWRYNNKKIVFDIVTGEDSLKTQDQQYKNRVKSFPDEYQRGNYSIKLSNLQQTDAGKYMCFILHTYESPTVNLTIKGV